MKKAFCSAFIFMAIIGEVKAQKWEPTMPDAPSMGEYNSVKSSFSDRSGGILEMNSLLGHITVDTRTDTTYFTTSSGTQSFSTSGALTTAGYNPSRLEFSKAFPGIDRPLSTFDPNDPVQGPIGPCAFVPCVRSTDPIDGRVILVEDEGYVRGSGPFPWTDSEFDQDVRGHENWRTERCDDFDESVLGSSLEAGPVAAACASSASGIGAALCAGGLIKQMWDVQKRASAQTDCSSSYPGPGRWEKSTLPRLAY